MKIKWILWVLILLDVVGKFFYTSSEGLNLFLANIGQDTIPLVLLAAILGMGSLEKREAEGIMLYLVMVVLYDTSLIGVGNTFLPTYLTSIYTWIIYAILTLSIFLYSREWNGVKSLFN